MPAEVIPDLALRGGRIQPTGRFFAGCGECHWMADPFFDQTAAMEYAANHNSVRHDGAEVTYTPDHPLIVASQVADTSLRRLRMAKYTAIGYTAFLSVLAVFLVTPWFVVSTATWGLFVCFYAWRWGVASEKYRNAQHNREIVGVLMEPGDDLTP